MASPTDALKRRMPTAGRLGGRPHITRYHSLAKEIRTDRTENHREAVALNVTWQRVKVLFARKGVVWTKGQ